MLLTYLLIKHLRIMLCLISGFTIVNAGRQFLLNAVLIVKVRYPHGLLWPWTRDTVSDYAISGLQQTLSHIYFDVLDKRNKNNQISASCARLGYVMVFLIAFSVHICPGWSIHVIRIVLCLLYQWLGSVDLICYLCREADHIFQYVCCID
jgi:hypothetical protein